MLIFAKTFAVTSIALNLYMFKFVMNLAKKTTIFLCKSALLSLWHGLIQVFNGHMLV